MSKIDLSKFNDVISQRGKVYRCTIEGITPLCYGKYHTTKRKDKESHADYERRTWKEKLHYDQEGQVYIPSLAFKRMLENACKYTPKQYKGKQTYTKHFEGGVMVVNNGYLGIHKDDERIIMEARHVPSDGKKGGTTRVERCFPVIEKWKTTVDINVIDNTITDDVFAEYFVESGWFIGLMSFRPRQGGINGRFLVKEIEVLNNI